MANRSHRGRDADRQASDDGQTVANLYEMFERLRRRHTRLGRLLRRREAEADDLASRRRGRLTTAATRQQVGYHDVWSRWSESYDDVAAAADRLLRRQPRSLADVIMLFGALEWVLLTDQVIVDRAAELQVQRFGRGLRQVAKGH